MNLAVVSLQNRAGRWVRPGPVTFQAAAAVARWSASDNFRALLIDLEGDQAYPITATVFVLMNKKAPRLRTRPALEFFRWSLTKGGPAAAGLGYVPLPAALVGQVERYWMDAFGAGS